LPDAKKRFRAVILTALPVEYAAVRSHLDADSIQEHVHKQGTVYEVGQFKGDHIDWDICLAEIGAGNGAAAFEAERAIAAFEPSVVLFVGIAGGLKDVSIGDIVFATKVYGYESGKDRSEFEPRPDVGESTYALEQRARAEAKRLDWLNRLASLSPNLAPRVFIGPVAAGEKVIASTRSATYSFLRKQYGDSLAVEMEGRGFMRVMRANKQVEAGVIRGISDLIDDKSAVELSGTQELASAHAAAFAYQLLDRFDTAQLNAGAPAEAAGVRYEVVIGGQFDECDLAFARAAFEFLKRRAKDPTMVLERIAAGSIVLVIRGSLASYQRLAFEFAVGLLSEIQGKKVTGISLGRRSQGGSREDTENSRKVDYKLAELKNEDVNLLYKRLYLIARSMLKRREGIGADLSAEDLVSEAMLRYLNGDRVRPADMDLTKFLTGVMRSIYSSQLEKIKLDARHFGRRIDEFSEADFVIDSLVNIEEESSAAEMLALVRETLKERPIELAVFDLIVQGETSAKEIAGKLQLSYDRVVSARKALRRTVSRLLDDRVLMARHH